MCPYNFGARGIFSSNFSRPRDELWSTNEKVIARILIHPNCSHTVSWRQSIRHVVFFGVNHQLPLLREEFRLPKLTFHSDLRRRAASRRAVPRTSSFNMKYDFRQNCFDTVVQTFAVLCIQLARWYCFVFRLITNQQRDEWRPSLPGDARRTLSKFVTTTSKLNSIYDDVLS